MAAQENHVDVVRCLLLLTRHHRRQRRRDHRGPGTPIFDLQGSINALDPCNNWYRITRGDGGGEGKNEKGEPVNI